VVQRALQQQKRQQHQHAAGAAAGSRGGGGGTNNARSNNARATAHTGRGLILGAGHHAGPMPPPHGAVGTAGTAALMFLYVLHAVILTRS
jgi:hypothetical protein